MNTLLLTDFYKINHKVQYPDNMTKLYSNFTPRKSRMKDVNGVVVFGIQHFVMTYLIKHFNENFFGKPEETVINEYKRHCNVDTTHISDLWNLGYLPIKLKCLPEGTICPIGVPMLTVTNTHPEFAWLVNYLETLLSCMLWQPITSATIAHEYKKVLDKFALKTTGSTEGVQWQGHDFSMRGMSSVETAILSGMGHLLSFTGTDTIPAIYQLEDSYFAEGLIGASVPATEHSIMCMGTKEAEIDTFRRLLDLYPTGILSVVSDTWDLWEVLTNYLPQLKEEILARDGKLVIRPDSGNPADIICGTNTTIKDISKYFPEGEVLPEYFEDYLFDEVREDTPHGERGVSEHSNIYMVRGELYKATVDNIQWNRYDKQYYFIDMYEDAHITVEKVATTPAQKGVIELLWDLFGGTINEQGYKVLDPHIGAIYGDGIGLHNLEDILSRLEAKGFASTNIVLGFGSYGYQYNTRDTFGFAMKATYGELTHKKFSGQYVEAREIFKDPITDSGEKKSKKGLLQVFERGMKGEIVCLDQCTWEQEDGGLLQTVFEGGKMVNQTTLTEIRNRLNN